MRIIPAILVGGMALASGSCAHGAPQAMEQLRLVEHPLGLAYAATEINATIFRLEALTSDAQFQYATYYDADGHIVVARRSLAGGDFEAHPLEVTGNVHDAHDDVVLGLSGDGVLHLSYDHHNQPLHYRTSSASANWADFSQPKGMTGHLETRVTYPTFLPGPAGDLYFFYRDGQSGNGRLCLDHYDPATHAWGVVQAPLLEGAGQSSPYWWRPEIDAQSILHVAWCWRDSPDASSNHDICYVRSRDGGKTWENSAGQAIAMPVTPTTTDTVVLKIARGQNLINTCALATDVQGRPHIAYYCNGPDGVPQYFHLWFDGQKWSSQQVSVRTQTFSLAGQGTLQIPISRPEIAVSKSGVVYLITRDNEFGGGVRLFASPAPYTQWRALDIIPGPLGEWEPTYDLARWHRDGVLSLFVLPVHQGNNERTTNFPPQTAKVVDVAGLQ